MAGNRNWFSLVSVACIGLAFPFFTSLRCVCQKIVLAVALTHALVRAMSCVWIRNPRNAGQGYFASDPIVSRTNVGTNRLPGKIVDPIGVAVLTATASAGSKDLTSNATATRLHFIRLLC